MAYSNCALFLMKEHPLFVRTPTKLYEMHASLFEHPASLARVFGIEAAVEKLIEKARVSA